MEISDLARICHEANKAFCEAIGDNSQGCWEVCSSEQRESVIEGVRLSSGKATVSPENSHESWRAWKIEHGWIYGETKDEQLKTHPNLMAYEELPEEQRAKDKLFTSIVDALKGLLEQEIQNGKQ